jgi:beta-glucanase (GH16 family)
MKELIKNINCADFILTINSKVNYIRHLLLNKLIIVIFVLMNVTMPVMAGWEIQWIDRFEGTEVDWNNWTAQTQANYNNEVQCYTDDDSSIDKNFDVSNGVLKIIARKQLINCPGLGGTVKTWTSGRINSKDKNEFLYGRIESRIRFNNLEVGSWPAFWMLENRINEQPIASDNDFVQWPNRGAGEIDVWEWYSKNPNSYITNFFNTSGCGNEQRYSYPNGATDVQQWHKYAIEWDKDNIRFFIDEIMVTSHNISNCAQYKEPMFALLNVAMGGNLGGNIDPNLLSVTMEVDYIAHCTATESNADTFCDENTPTLNDNDEDNDGVINESDLCSFTLINETVDTNGCSESQEANIAPEVNLSISQNGANITTVNPQNGLVTISANITDVNVNDTHTLEWITTNLPNPVTTDNIITFNPTSMLNGNYSVDVVVTDDGSLLLTGNSSLSFNVVVPLPETNAESGGGSGGGSFGIYLLILLGGLIVKMRTMKIDLNQLNVKKWLFNND